MSKEEMTTGSQAEVPGRRGPGGGTLPDSEVAAKPTRRRFTTEYKLRILREVDSQREVGGIGAVLRREGLYSTHLSAWRRERERGAVETLRRRRRGRQPDPSHRCRQQVAALQESGTGCRSGCGRRR